MASPAIRIQWHNETYHNLMLQGKQTVDQAKRAEIYKKAQQLMYEECPVIPIAHSAVMWPGLKKVQNFKLHPTGSVYLRSVWFQ
jgi:peptide/nickel transport system substrate-binding protein